MSPDKQERARHKLAHKALYDGLVMLVADWYAHTGNYEGSHTVEELLDWAREQSREPTEFVEGYSYGH